jgi:hypothetical protein
MSDQSIVTSFISDGNDFNSLFKKKSTSTIESNIYILGPVYSSIHESNMRPYPWDIITTPIDDPYTYTHWFWNTYIANDSAPSNDMPITFKYPYTSTATETLEVYIVFDNLCNFYFNGNIQLIDINGIPLKSMESGSTLNNRVFSVNVVEGKTYSFEFDCCNISGPAGFAVWCQGPVPDGKVRGYRFNSAYQESWSSYIKSSSGFFVGREDLYSLFEAYPNVTSIVTRSLVKQASNVGGLSLSDIFAPIVMGSNSTTLPISTSTTIQYFINLYNATSYSYSYLDRGITTVSTDVTDISSEFTITVDTNPILYPPSIAVYNGTIIGTVFEALVLDISSASLMFSLKIESNTIPLKDDTNSYEISNNGGVSTVFDNRINDYVLLLTGRNNLKITEIITPVNCTRTFWAYTVNPTFEDGERRYVRRHVLGSQRWPTYYAGSGGLKMESYTQYQPIIKDSTTGRFHNFSWVFYAMTINSSSLSMYVNGNTTPVATGRVDTIEYSFQNWGGDHTPLQIGHLSGNASYGNEELRLSNIRQYSTVLSPEEIKNIYLFQNQRGYIRERYNIYDREIILDPGVKPGVTNFSDRGASISGGSFTNMGHYIAISSDGQYVSVCTYNAIYASSDNGLSFTTYTPPSEANFYCISMNLSGQYQLACSTGKPACNIYVSRDYGVTWVMELNATTDNQVRWFHTCCVNDNGSVMFCGGHALQNYYSYNRGYTWIEMYDTNKNDRIASVVNNSINTVYLIDTANDNFCINSPINNSNCIESSVRMDFNIAMRSRLGSDGGSNLIIAAGQRIITTETIEVHISNDGGTSWSYIETPIERDNQCINVTYNGDATKIIIGNRKFIWIQTVGSSTWDKIVTSDNRNLMYFRLSADGNKLQTITTTGFTEQYNI